MIFMTMTEAIRVQLEHDRYNAFLHGHSLLAQISLPFEMKHLVECVCLSLQSHVCKDSKTYIKGSAIYWDLVGGVEEKSVNVTPQSFGTKCSHNKTRCKQIKENSPCWFT